MTFSRLGSTVTLAARRMRRALLVTVLAVIAIGPSLVGVEAAPVEAQELQIPGPDFPVGPTNWDILVDVPTARTFTSGKHTIENVRYLKGIVVRGSTTEVILRNCHVVNPGSFWTIYVHEGAKLTMEDCQIGSETGNAGERGVGAHNVTLRRVKIVGHEDGIKAGRNGLYEQVWVTGMRGRDGETDPHEDGIQDDGGGQGWTLRYSRVELPYLNGKKPTSAVIIKSDLGPISDVVLENNIFNGGGYTLYSRKGTNYPIPTNVVIRNNGFGRDYAYGILSEDGSGVVWQNNYWIDTRQCFSKSRATVPCTDTPPTTTTTTSTTTTTQAPTTTTTTTTQPPTTTTTTQPPPTTTTTTLPPTTTTTTTLPPTTTTTTLPPTTTTTQPPTTTTTQPPTGTGCPDPSPTVVVGTADSRVPNRVVGPGLCTLDDLLPDEERYPGLREFRSAMQSAVRDFRSKRLISSVEENMIIAAANNYARSGFPQ